MAPRSSHGQIVEHLERAEGMFLLDISLEFVLVSDGSLVWVTWLDPRKEAKGFMYRSVGNEMDPVRSTVVVAEARAVRWCACEKKK